MSAAPSIEPTAPARLVTLRGIGKTFAGGTRALAGLDLEVRRGEFLTLLGPSGCGKSTALRLIAGLGSPSEGAIAWSGTPSGQANGPDGGADDAPGNGQDLSFVFQEPTLMPWASVRNNVMLPLRLRGMERAAAEATVAAALDRVGLAEFADTYPRELSGGMKMRVSIARALVTQPKLLLLDEPFAALDEITRFRLNDDLLALWKTLRKTIVFVTHSVFESVYLSTRIVVMTPRPGRVFSELSIDAPHPRDARFRTSAEYAGYCRLASQALAQAIAST